MPLSTPRLKITNGYKKSRNSRDRLKNQASRHLVLIDRELWDCEESCCILQSFPFCLLCGSPVFVHSAWQSRTPLEFGRVIQVTWRRCFQICHVCLSIRSCSTRSRPAKAGRLWRALRSQSSWFDILKAMLLLIGNGNTSVVDVTYLCSTARFPDGGFILIRRGRSNVKYGL